MTGRSRGFGALSIEAQDDIIQSYLIRKKLTDKALAEKHCVSIQTVKGTIARHARKLVSSVVTSVQTPAGESRVAEESGQQAV